MTTLLRSAGYVVGAIALLSAACVHRQLALDDAGQGGDVGGFDTPADAGAPADADAPADASGDRITEADWQMMIAPRSGAHAINDRNAGTACQPVTIGQDYLVQPTVGCSLTDDHDSGGNPIYACTVEPFCTRHDECQEYPRGTCQGSRRAVCAYPGAERTPCMADSDCTAVPGGSCPLQGSQITACYPTGRCVPPGRTCFYPDQQCTSDADCTAAAGGTCAKSALLTRCEYQMCMIDADCATGTRCLCGTTNACIVANCNADGDCAAGQQCRLLSNCIMSAYLCTTDLDTCRDGPDCGSGKYCTFKDGRRQCAPALCPIVP
ncbi:MAG TPA: hypothetical protein VIQ54_08115 [Polyangia bacterium]